MKVLISAISGTPQYKALPSVDTGLTVVIGKKGAPVFSPCIDVSAWGGECTLQLELEGYDTGDKSFDTSAGKVQWSDGKKDASFYSVDHADDTPEGAIEFDLTVPSAPSNNKIVFNVHSTNVVFYRQPFMTELIGHEGIVTATETTAFDRDGNIVCQCRDNIPGSFAVYHADPPKNYLGGTVYKSGKVGHIYRPKITDAKGNSVYGTLSFNNDFAKLTLDIPKSFLDAAVYPVTIDPTFGYTTIGGTRSPKDPSSDDICPVASALTYVAATGDKIISYNVYADGGGSTGGHIDCAAYSIVAGVPVTRLAAAVTINIPASASWVSSAAVSQSMTNGVRYGFGVGNYIVPTWTYYDTGSGNQQSTNASGALPATWTSSGFATSMGSRYCTYSNAVTVALAGSRATSGRGTVKSNTTLYQAGVRATSGRGTVKAALTKTAIGSHLTSVTGAVKAALSKLLTGQGAALALGAVKTAFSKLLTGQGVAASLGALKAGLQSALIGESTVASPGTVGVRFEPPLTGENTAAAPGVLEKNIAVRLCGKKLTSSAGYLNKIVNIINLPHGLILKFGDVPGTHPVRIKFAGNVYGLFTTAPTDDHAGCVRVLVGSTVQSLVQDTGA